MANDPQPNLSVRVDPNEMLRYVQNLMIAPHSATMPETTMAKSAQVSDIGFRWFIRRILDVIPDVERFDMFDSVGEGFNIGGTQMIVGFVLLSGYLLPWFILAYYLIKWREIASST